MIFYDYSAILEKFYFMKINYLQIIVIFMLSFFVVSTTIAYEPAPRPMCKIKGEIQNVEFEEGARREFRGFGPDIINPARYKLSLNLIDIVALEKGCIQGFSNLELYDFYVKKETTKGVMNFQKGLIIEGKTVGAYFESYEIESKFSGRVNYADYLNHFLIGLTGIALLLVAAVLLKKYKKT